MAGRTFDPNMKLTVVTKTASSYYSDATV